MSMKVAVLVIVSLALVVSAAGQRVTDAGQKATISIVATEGKYSWALKKGDKVLAESQPFDTKQGARKSATAFLANAGDKDRCKVMNGSAKVFSGNGVGQTTDELETDASLKVAQKMACEEIHKAVRAVISQYFADLKEGEPKKAGSSRVSVELKKSDKDIKKPFFWHIKADNGEIVLRSQMYAAEGAAIMDLVSVCVYGGVKANYELKSTKNGEFHFHINAQRNEIVGTSQTFTTLSDGKKGIDGVQEKIRVILSAIVDPETAEEQLQAQEQPKREQRKPKQQDQISEQLHPKLLPTNTVQHASPQVPARQGQAQATQAQVHGGQGQVHAQAATKQQGDRDGNDVTDDDSDTDIENVDKDDDQ